MSRSIGMSVLNFERSVIESEWNSLLKPTRRIVRISSGKMLTYPVVESPAVSNGDQSRILRFDREIGGGTEKGRSCPYGRDTIDENSQSRSPGARRFTSSGIGQGEPARRTRFDFFKTVKCEIVVSKEGQSITRFVEFSAQAPSNAFFKVGIGPDLDQGMKIAENFSPNGSDVVLTPESEFRLDACVTRATE